MNQPEDQRDGFHPDSARDLDRSVTARRQEQDTGQRPGSVVTAARALDTDGGRQRDLRLRTVERPDEERRDEERPVEQTQQDGPQTEQIDPAETQVELRRDEQLVHEENAAAKHEAAMLMMQAGNDRTDEQVDDRAVDDPSTSVREDELGLAEGNEDRGRSYGHDAQAGRVASIADATRTIQAMDKVPNVSLDGAQRRQSRVAARTPARQPQLSRSAS